MKGRGDCRKGERREGEQRRREQRKGRKGSKNREFGPGWRGNFCERRWDMSWW